MVLMPTSEAMSISGVGQVSSLPTHSLTNTLMTVSLETIEERNMQHTSEHTHFQIQGTYAHTSPAYCNLQSCMIESVRSG